MTDGETPARDRRRADPISAMIEFSGEAIISSTLEGVITSWNPAAERMYGYAREEIIGKPARVMTPEDRADQISAILARVRAGQTIENLETLGVRKDGTIFPVSLTLAPIRDLKGLIAGISQIASDMTDSKRAEQQLHEMVALLESSTAALIGESDAIVGATLEAVVTSWNPGAERMFGYSSQEMIGNSLMVLVPKDRVDEANELRERVKAGLATERFESVRIRKDGTTFPVQLTISPIKDVNGAVTGVSTIVRDVTEQKRARREIADWRDKAFRWMEELERFQRLSVLSEFERELKVIDLQHEIERLKRLAPPELGESSDEP